MLFTALQQYDSAQIQAELILIYAILKVKRTCFWHSACFPMQKGG